MGVILTDLLTLIFSCSIIISGEADLLTGRDLLNSLPFFTELTPEGLVAREDMRAGCFVAVQASSLRKVDFRVTGGGGFLTGELLTAGLLAGIFVFEIIVFGGTLGRDTLVCRVIFGSSLVTGVIFTLLGSFL